MQLSHNTSNHHSTGRDFGIFDQREHENRGPNVQQPQENTAEQTFGDGQDSGGAHCLIQSGGPRGEAHVLVYAMVYNDHC